MGPKSFSNCRFIAAAESRSCPDRFDGHSCRCDVYCHKQQISLVTSTELPPESEGHYHLSSLPGDGYSRRNIQEQFCPGSWWGRFCYISSECLDRTGGEDQWMNVCRLACHPSIHPDFTLLSHPARCSTIDAVRNVATFSITHRLKHIIKK